MIQLTVLILALGVVCTSCYSWETDEHITPVNTNCTCGWVNKGRIVGGKETKKNQFPLIVSVEYADGGQFCGGTILTPWHIITAAHCLYDKEPEDVKVRVGVHDVSKGQGITHRIQKIMLHEQYDRDSYLNDIALLVPQSQIKFNQNVGPACLSDQRLEFQGQRLKALGWGKLEHNGRDSSTLQTVDLKVIPFNECEQEWDYSDLHPMKDTNICTYELRKDTCNGDSGGPLIWLNPNTNRYTLAALVSFGGKCAGNQPAVNTDVPAYYHWIRTKIEETNPEVTACVKV